MLLTNAHGLSDETKGAPEDRITHESIVKRFVNLFCRSRKMTTCDILGGYGIYIETDPGDRMSRVSLLPVLLERSTVLALTCRKRRVPTCV